MQLTQVKKVDTVSHMEKAIQIYGESVLEDRSIPDYRDGLKPVHRRVLWTMYQLGLHQGVKLVKAAKIVGDCLGSYHPHSDDAVMDTITTLTWQPVSPVHGEGNWGSLMGDNAAAMRYPLARLTEYGRLFFDPYYTAVLETVPTYDAATQEPVILYPMLPQLLINGVAGIGVGASTEIPAFTLKSVVELLLAATKTKGGATAEMCFKHLEFQTISGSVVRKTGQQKQLMDFFRTGRGAVVHNSRVSYDAKQNVVVVSGVAPFQGTTAYVNKLFGVADSIEGVAGADDQTKGRNLRLVYSLKRGADGKAVKDAVEAFLTSTKHYKVNVTERVRVIKNGYPETEVKFRPSTIHDIVNGWLKWRASLEVRATKYHLAKLDEAIRKNEVLRLACKHRDFIFGLAKSNKTDPQIKLAIKNTLKVSESEAAFVFDMKWRSLRSLEDKAIAAKMVEQAKLRKSYEQRIAKPGAYVVKHLTELSAQF